MSFVPWVTSGACQGVAVRRLGADFCKRHTRAADTNVLVSSGATYCFSSLAISGESPFL